MIEKTGVNLNICDRFAFTIANPSKSSVIERNCLLILNRFIYMSENNGDINYILPPNSILKTNKMIGKEKLNNNTVYEMKHEVCVGLDIKIDNNNEDVENFFLVMEIVGKKDYLIEYAKEKFKDMIEQAKK